MHVKARQEVCYLMFEVILLMRILLADDQTEIRSALRLLLDQDENSWEIIQEVENFRQLLKEVELLRPDLIILDWELQGFAPTSRASARQPLPDIVGELRAIHSGIKILVLSGRIEAQAEALAAGADAFVSKGDPPEFLLEKLHHLSNIPT
jgi:DNA-binding NarL/FixJ family response regulator